MYRCRVIPFRIYGIEQELAFEEVPDLETLAWLLAPKNTSSYWRRGSGSYHDGQIPDVHLPHRQLRISRAISKYMAHLVVPV